MVHGATLYLDIVKTQEERWTGPDDPELMTYYGYKFEALCTAGGGLWGGVLCGAAGFAA